MFKTKILLLPLHPVRDSSRRHSRGSSHRRQDKGQKISLAKVVPGLTEIFIGLGWDTNLSDYGYDFDLDASVFLLGSNGK